MACFKRKKKGMLHLLVASFRALPLDLMVPVSRRGFVWIFSSIFFSSFLFFLCPFSLGFSIQTRYLSSIVSLDTFAHAHSQKSAGASARKSLGRFITLILTWSGQDEWIADISFRVSFSNDHRVRKRGTLQKMSRVDVSHLAVCYFFLLFLKPQNFTKLLNWSLFIRWETYAPMYFD